VQREHVRRNGITLLSLPFCSAIFAFGGVEKRERERERERERKGRKGRNIAVKQADINIPRCGSVIWAFKFVLKFFIIRRLFGRRRERIERLQ